MGPTLKELASDDRVLHGLLMAYQTQHTAHRVRSLTKALTYTTILMSLKGGQDYCTLGRTIHD